MWTIFLGTIVALVLLIPFLTADWMIAQAQNATLIENENNTRTIVNMKDRLVFLVNATTNKTISVSNFTGNIGNATTDETISASNFTGNIGNTTTNQSLVANETTNVRNLTENPGNTTTNQNLTSKFKELQGN